MDCQESVGERMPSSEIVERSSEVSQDQGIQGDDELAGLEGLKVVSQEDLEQSLINEAEGVLARKAEGKWRERLKNVSDKISDLTKEREDVENRLVTTAGSLRQVQKLSARLDEIPKLLEDLEKAKSFFAEMLSSPNSTEDGFKALEKLQSVAHPDPSLELSVKTGLMTPFGTSLTDVAAAQSKNGLTSQRKNKPQKPVGFEPHDPLKKSLMRPKKRPKKEKLGTKRRCDLSDVRGLKPGLVPGEMHSMPRDSDEDSDEYVPEFSDESDDEKVPANSDCKPKKPKLSARRKTPRLSERIKDDGSYSQYQKRLRELKKERAREKYEKINNGEIDDEDYDEKYETFPGGYKISTKIWNKLFHYQQITVRWLWELKTKKCGGIVGDEMGLGKTVQIIAFLAGLRQSNLYDPDFDVKGLGPVLIVTPTTVMHQWVAEFRRWYPEFRVAILHSSGSFGGRKDDLIREMLSCDGILITSYSGMVQAEESLVNGDWHYVILDEGHKIRNPDALVTRAAKNFKTPHRIILSGSPLQNNLRELWSLFDFIFPGKLGTLDVFMKEFSVPITLGGYATATDVEVATAYRCAVVLKDTIAPYMIRRMKANVQDHINLPTKNEQVLFCKLTDAQRELYLLYLECREMRSILDGSQLPFVGLTILRKICNHPHIYDGGPKNFGNENQMKLPEEERFGYWKLSGKMIVLESLLRIWKKQNHKVLLFTQSRQMLAILEAFVQERSYTYLKIDGTTTIGSRQPLIKRFNEDPDLFVFLLTTRVGGLGVNLTGATRVIIYDPDWNPSTDMQARERAWRIGQTKHVTIYRLITTGTIEEKIYHRQIFKQYLTNRVLNDPVQRRFFKSNELRDLFTLDDHDAKAGDKKSIAAPESADIFAGTGSEINLHKLAKKKSPKKRKLSESEGPVEDEKDAKKRLMMELARKLSQKIGGKGSQNGISQDQAISTTSSSGKKEKKKKFAKVDGERVKNVVKRRNFKSAAQSTLAAEGVEDEDDYVLRKLFKKSGVHAALRHDKIVNETAPDHALVEGEAEKLAQNAVDALRRSRSFYEGFSRYGGESRFQSTKTPEKAPRFGQKTNAKLKKPAFGKKDGESNVSSAEILARAAERNRFNCMLGSRRKDDGDNDIPEVSSETRDLLDEIRTFVAFRAKEPGQATTDEVLTHFRDKLPDGKAPIFKAILSKLCDFHKDSSGGRLWILKGEFR